VFPSCHCYVYVLLFQHVVLLCIRLFVFLALHLVNIYCNFIILFNILYEKPTKKAHTHTHTQTIYIYIYICLHIIIT